ncbi:hypothetical protein BDP27DRAFT_1427382 [Rhodocollybia butyracea]|uniref:Uncharacterized protein n=1 Tax=Rhodocollybia butyracea TaxID=206335 RepID=A0A9P5PIZ5_9AGAR|nr:hypothetical protein BDP27DRAFT_1427382 [Rhodocollybia butyracea]
MRFIFLWFAAIVGSMLAVCPMPVPGPDGTAGSSSAKAAPAKLTFVDLRGFEIPRPEGKVSRELLQLYASTTKRMSDEYGLRFGGSIDYDGLYKPVEINGLPWLYFHLEGLSEQCTTDDPCKGWMVHVGGFCLESKSKIPKAKENGHRRWYVHISKVINGQWTEVRDFKLDSINKVPADQVVVEATEERRKKLQEQFEHEYKEAKEQGRERSGSGSSATTRPDKKSKKDHKDHDDGVVGERPATPATQEHQFDSEVQNRPMHPISSVIKKDPMAIPSIIESPKESPPANKPNPMAIDSLVTVEPKKP